LFVRKFYFKFVKHLKIENMNLVDCYVTKVLSAPYFKYFHWFVDVEYDCYGVIDKTFIMLETEEECLNIKIGSHFLN